MRILIPLALCLAVLAGPTAALELVINGTFEENLPVGWVQGGWGNGYAYRATTLDPDPDYEVLVGKTTGTGSYKLHQHVVIPSSNVEFSCAARITATATSTAWAAAALVLSYTDHDNLVLGETVIVARTSYCPWVDSPTFHMIPVADASWHTYAFNLTDELMNLPGIDPQDVRGIRITLSGSAADC